MRKVHLTETVLRAASASDAGALAALEAALEEKTERWLYLTELDEKIRAQ